MTEQEKQEAIEDLQIHVNGVVSYLVLLRDVARNAGSEDLYPIFKDGMVQNLLARYEELQTLRGY